MLNAETERQFRANAAAWYRRTAIHWVVSAKREETRQKRLAELIADSEQGRRVKTLTRTKTSQKKVIDS